MLRTGLILFITFLLFEGAFRLYVIDFYGSIFEHLNDNFKKKSNAKELLLIGDSFSAFKEGYAKVLYDSLPAYNVSNISVPGTSVREQYLFGRHYLKRKGPKALVFQYYVGNDLLGWAHPMNWEEVSPSRNIYWWLSERFWSLSYINYRLMGLKFRDIDQQATENVAALPFSPERYTLRDKLYFRAEPGIVENSLYLKNGRSVHFEAYMARMKKLFKHAAHDSKIYVLVIPHVSQLSHQNMEKFQSIGAQFSDGFTVGDTAPAYLTKLKEYFADDERVHWVDPLETLAAAEAEGHQAYFANDSHLNYFGQALVGEYLIANIRKTEGD